MDSIRKRLSYANVMSSLALFLVLGGATAFAATQVSKNSVGTPQLKKNAVKAAKINKGAVTTAKIADGAVITAKLADGSVLTAKIADASITTEKIAENAITTAKIANDAVTGEKVNEATLGEVPQAGNALKLDGKAPTSFLGSTVYKGESPVEAGTTLCDGTEVISQACNPGDVLLSGGPANIAATTTLLESFPTPGTTNAWTARVNKNTLTDNFSVVVLCVDQ
jgi:hypothetical protein